MAVFELVLAVLGGIALVGFGGYFLVSVIAGIMFMRAMRGPK